MATQLFFVLLTVTFVSFQGEAAFKSLFLLNNESSLPAIRIVEGDSFDWGQVAPSTVRKTFHIVNSGDAPLIIKEIHQSCGCTTAPIDKTEIVPGDTGSLSVSVDMHDKSGDQRKEVFLITNDPKDSIVTISLRANVVRDVESQPIVFPTVLQATVDQEFETEVLITNTGTDTINFKPPFLDGYGIKVKFALLNSQLLPGQNTILKAMVTPTTLGYHMGKVVLNSNSKFSPSMIVDLRFLCEKRIPSTQDTSNSTPNMVDH